MNASLKTRVVALTTLTVAALLAVPAVADPPPMQLPARMHEPVAESIRIRVGHPDAAGKAGDYDFTGRDNRVLQAAVDLAATFDTGSARPVVEIGPGRFEMRDSLHLRTGVEVRGVPGKTILAPRRAVMSRLALDGDYGEEQITLEAPEGFEVGGGVLVESDNVKYFHGTVARIIGRSGKTFVLDQPLRADCMVNKNARASTVFPVVSGCDVERARVDGLVIDGGGADGLPIDGCRGAGIYLLRAHGTTIAHCEIRNFPGDGVSYQQSNDVSVLDTVAVGNAGHGFHPGSGSQRTVMARCRAEKNRVDGMFICWRVKQGKFEDNLFIGNVRNGISIGHKDTDNVIAGNKVQRNGAEGILFRDELPAMAANRNRVIDNTVEDNGEAGIRVRGVTSGNEIRDNTVRDTRTGADRRQTTDIVVEPSAVGNVVEGNTNE